MAKLEKRQMIILGVMCIAVLFGAYSFLMPAQKAKPGVNTVRKAEELNTFVNDLNASLGKDTTKSLSGLIFARAEKEWTPDPFLESRSYKTWFRSREPAKEGSGVAKKTELFIYSGYLEAGRRQMAIINGFEYREGEKLDMKGYFLKSVTPTGVVIENMSTKARQSVPLQEYGGTNVPPKQ